MGEKVPVRSEVLSMGASASRARLWQIKKVKMGLCRICGKEPIYLDQRCRNHYIKHREYVRGRYSASIRGRYHTQNDAAKLNMFGGGI